MKCPPDCHAHPPAIKTCAPDCREHRCHIYIICYGKLVKVRDRDYLRADGEAWGSGYLITHYVGFTTQLPVDRVRQHGALSAHFLVEVRPGTEADELDAKLYEKCPRCGGSLWYFAESPTYKRRYRRQIIRLRRQQQRKMELRRQRRGAPGREPTVKGRLRGRDAMFIDCPPGCPKCLVDGPLTVIVPRERGEQLVALAAGMEPVEVTGPGGVRVTVPALAVLLHDGDWL